MRVVGWTLLIVTGVACGTSHKPLPDPTPNLDEWVWKQQPAPRQPRPSSTGSLWRVDGDFAHFGADPKAFRIGDVVTVLITESTSGTNTADTDLSRASSAGFGFGNLFGLEDDLGALDAANLVNATNNKAFSGNGTTTRSNSLAATLSVRVIGITDQGNLVLAGTKTTVVNSEEQQLLLTGMVRPVDIQPNNTVVSSVISDLHIELVGHGEVNASTREGWLARFLSWAWPF